MSKRHLAATALSFIPFGLSRSLRAMQRGNWLTVLCYHRILDIGPDFPFDEDLVSASTDQFAEQLALVSKQYSVINFRGLKEHVDRTGTIPPRSLIITFDDGYADNYSVAWPLLRRFGLTATFFAAAGFIGTSRLFWWDRIASIVKRSSADRLHIDSPVGIDLSMGGPGGRQAAARRVIRAAKFLPEERKEELIGALSRELGVEPGEDGPRQTMTWDELRELDRAGMEIGAHSIGHPIFSNIDDDRIRREVAGSKDMIEREIGSPVITFGSPGRGVLDEAGKRHFDGVLREAVVGSGYSFSTMYRWGLVHADRFDPYAIERLGIESFDGSRIFRAKLLFPEIVTY